MTGAGRRLALAPLALAAALVLALAAGAQGFRQPPGAAAGNAPDIAPATALADAAPAVGGSPGAAPDAPGVTLAETRAAAAPTASAGPTTTGPATSGGPALLGLVSLPGGDATPVCRAGCAATLYRCAAAGGDDTCQAAARTCRTTCDTTSQVVGRIVSPLPQAGLAPAGALRALPGSLATPPAGQ